MCRRHTSKSLKNLKDLGYGICFDLRQANSAIWLEPNKIAEKRRSLSADILAFDWWMKNFNVCQHGLKKPPH